MFSPKKRKSALEKFRAQVDAFIGKHPQSPLSRKQQRKFKGLPYFAEDKAFVFEVEVNRFPDNSDLITMQTSTGDVVQYRRWGSFTFNVQDEEASLTIFSDPGGHDFFMPFKDASNGQETYGAGRYLDNHRPGIQHIGENTFIVDFNHSYNPYCAYSPEFSCPLPPRENWLTVSILAGEKKFE